jgi:Fe2+ transport system protein B
MDFEKYIAAAFDYAAWFTSSVIGTVSGSVFGGWMAVAGFVGFIVVMFILTSLASPRR